MSDENSQDFIEALDTLRQRFPDIRCVRCTSDRFLMRVWRDRSFAPAFGDARIIEIVCENCGFIERHAMEGLKGELAKPGEKAGVDG